MDASTRRRLARVLLAYDGSPDADRAVELAATIDWPADATIRVVTVVDLTMTYAGPFNPGALVAAPELDEQIVAYHRQALDKAVGRLRAAGRSVEGALLRGRPATMLVDETAGGAADLVIIGSRGHGAVASLVLGSVSAEVVDHAACPVLVARQPTLSRVVLGSDGSEDARRAEDVLAGWPIFDGVEVRVVSAADVVRPWHTGIAPTMIREVAEAYARDVETATAEHEAIATAAAERLGAAGRPASHVVKVGDAAGEIVEQAQAWGADLIVVGSRGLTGLSRIMLGSVARNVLHASEASVLVVRKPGEG